MKKLILVFWGTFTVNNLPFKVFQYFSIFALISFPCYSDASFLAETGKIRESIIQTPNLFKAQIPCFIYIRFVATPKNVMLQDGKPVYQGAARGVIATMPIESNSSYDAYKCPDKTREKTRERYRWYHYVFFYLLFLVCGLSVFPIAFFLFLCFAGHLEQIFAKDFLKKMHIPKFLYDDPYDYS